VDEAPSTSPSSAATMLSPDDLRRAGKTEPGQRRRDPAADALMTLTSAGPDSGGPVHGVVFRGPPLRHRRPSRLPQGGRPARVRPRRHRSGLPRLARRVHRSGGGGADGTGGAAR
jgi:hypothetical protein